VAQQVQVEQELAALTGHVDLFGAGTINWNAPEQVKELLRARGHDIEKTDEDVLQRLVAQGEPLAPLLLRYRDASKRAGTYGIEWIRHVHKVTGRIHPDYRQLGSTAGRMSCDGPNLQNVPRNPVYRACFRPSPGRVLIKGDYGQIELRLAAVAAGDVRMIEAFERGDDLHVLTASAVLGKAKALVTDKDRQLGKTCNFALLYGQGVRGFRDTIARDTGQVVSEEEARRLRSKFFSTYQGLRDWQDCYREPWGQNTPLDTRTVPLGRRRLGVKGLTFKLNSPIQGAGADGLKMALALLWETRSRAPDAAPVLCVHDEIVVECGLATAEATHKWLVEAMTCGMETVLQKVPVEVEAKVCADWSGTPVTDPWEDEAHP
jgi:DNA polymerase-1